MTTYVSLLRGINLGAGTQVSMAELKQLYLDLGLADVATYIRSGNVVFGADDGPEAVRARIEAALADRFGMRLHVVIRTHQEMADVVARNPFADRDPARLTVVFLAAAMPGELARELDASDFGDDEYVDDGREIYLHLPNGFGRSRLAARMSALRGPVIGTARNWRTVVKLVEMSS